MKTVKLTLMFSLILCIQSITHGQELRPISQIRFCLGINGYQPLKIENTGEKLIKSRVMPAPSGQIALHQEIAYGFGFNIGCGIEFDPFSIGYKFDTPKNSVLYSGTSDAGFNSFHNTIIHQALYTLPIGIEKVINLNSFRNSVEFGIKFNKLVAFPYSIGYTDTYQTMNGDDIEVFRYFQVETQRYFLTYYLKVGLLEINNSKSLKLNAVVHYSPDAIGSGTYEFKELGFESYGTTKQRNNYIGVEVTYGLTVMKK